MRMCVLTQIKKGFMRGIIPLEIQKIRLGGFQMQNKNNNQQMPAQAQAALNQFRQTAKQLAQTEQMNAQQFQQSSPQVQQAAPGFAGRELNAAQQLNQIEQSAQQLQQSVGQQQFTSSSSGSPFSTEFASETNVEEVRKQNQQSQANKNR